MSDLSVTGHNLGALLAGTIDFNQFLAGEGALIKQNIASVAPALQPALTVAFESFKAGASSLVGMGLTAAGPILAESSDQQATQVLNLLGLLGVPTAGPLSIAEHAMLQTAIAALKTGLDKIGIQIATNGAVSVKPAA